MTYYIANDMQYLPLNGNVNNTEAVFNMDQNNTSKPKVDANVKWLTFIAA